MMKRNISILHLINGNGWAAEIKKKTYRTDYVNAYTHGTAERELILMMGQKVNDDAFCLHV